MITSHQSTRRTIIALLTCTVIILFLVAHSDHPYNPLPSWLNPIKRQRYYFHLLVPASNSNINLCRLLFSAAVLNYPTPILIGWNATGEYDIRTSHIGKITGVIRYLESLPPQQDDDLVLIVDGYDVLLQLRPDVLIQRFFDVNAAANQRLADDFGHSVMAREDIRQSILFGPDKFCWPADYNRPACWAIPQSTVDKWALGPHTDSGGSMNRARWLSSGTIMGNRKELLELFKGTMVMMNKEYDESADDKVKNSDQMYLADLWGTQEWARTELFKNMSRSWTSIEHFNDNRQPPQGDARYPKLDRGQKTEFHIGLDYESALFQTAAGYEAWLSWMRYDYFNPSTKTIATSDSPASKIKKNLRRRSSKKNTAGKFYLPDDIWNSPPPFPPGFIPEDGVRSDKPTAGKGVHTWADLHLGTNTASKQVFAAFHLKGAKDAIDFWWSRMWYVPYGMELLRAAVSEARIRRPVSGKINGRLWWNAEGEDELEKPWNENGGAWGDLGTFLPWEGMCEQHEEKMFA